MAELLVKAKDHWMDKLTQVEVDKMSASDKQSYEARSQKGDIIVVRPDGWQWGKEECLPNYIVVKVPGMTVEEAKKYEEQLSETVAKEYTLPDGKKVTMNEQKLIRVRKHAFPKTDVDLATTGEVSLNKTVLTSKVIIKTGAATEFTQPK